MSIVILRSDCVTLGLPSGENQWICKIERHLQKIKPIFGEIHQKSHCR